MKSEITTLKLNSNHEGRDFIVGDLHGCYSLLMEKLEEASFDKSVDRLFCVGDLIDRGPDSAKCLELLLEPWFFATYGNHELMFLTYMEEYYSSYHSAIDFYYNGGNWVGSVDKLKLDEYVKLIKEKMYGIIDVEDAFYVTHSELDYSLIRLDTFTWNRAILYKIDNTPPIAEKDNTLYANIYDPTSKITYVGHNTLKKRLFINNDKVKNHLIIDTGAYRGKPYDLSLIEHKKFLDIVKEIK